MKSQDFLDKLERIGYRTDFNFNVRMLTQYFAWYFKRQKRYLNLDFIDKIQIRFIHEAVSYLSTVTQENNGEIFILLNQYMDAIKINPFPDINSHKNLALRKRIFEDCSIIYRAINKALSYPRYDIPLAQLFFAHDRYLEQKAAQLAAIFWTDHSADVEAYFANNSSMYEGEFSTTTRDKIAKVNVIKYIDKYVLFLWNASIEEHRSNNVRIELFKNSEVTIEINGKLMFHEAIEIIEIAIANWLYKLHII